MKGESFETVDSLSPYVRARVYVHNRTPLSMLSRRFSDRLQDRTKSATQRFDPFDAFAHRLPDSD
jgi:hypothetical protein